MNTLQTRLAALTVEINKIKDEIHDKSIPQTPQPLDELRPPTGVYKKMMLDSPQSQQDFTFSYFNNSVSGSVALREGPLDLKQLQDEEQNGIEEFQQEQDILQLLDCVDAVCKGIEEEEDEEEDFLNLVNQAIKVDKKSEDLPQMEKNSFDTKSRNISLQPATLQYRAMSSDERFTPQSAQSSPLTTSTTKSIRSYQIPRLEYNPIEEEEDTMLESAARPIQNKYLYFDSNHLDQSMYPSAFGGNGMMHKDGGDSDMSLASLEYLKRHDLGERPSTRPSSRPRVYEMVGETSRFLDVEKIRKLSKLK